jgi:type I restriction enzyme S subunit
VTRLRHVVDQVATVQSDGPLPFVALEHMQSGTGGFATDAVIEDKEVDPAGMVQFSPGDVMFGKLRPYLRKSWLADRSGLCSSELIVMRPRPGQADSRWLAYAVQAQPFVDWAIASSEGVKMPRTSWEKLGLYELDPPPVMGQRAIADYLDAETAWIDRAITIRQRQAELAREWLVSATESSVLGANQARLVRGGYFGIRPSHWLETSLRHLGYAVQTGPFGSDLHADDYVEGGSPIINPMHLVHGHIAPSSSMSVTDDKRGELLGHVLHKDDIVVARRGELGRVALVGESEVGYLCGTGCVKLRTVGSPLRPQYLARLLSSAPLRGFFETASVGSTMDNLSSETLLGAPVLVPSLNDQEVIEAEARRSQEHFEMLSGSLSRQVSLLQERRHALITAAVTGQIEIPGVAA